MRQVKVSDLKVGDTIACDVPNLHGQVLLATGTVVGPKHGMILKAWGITEVVIAGESTALSEPCPATPAVAAAPLAEPSGEILHPAVAEIVRIAAEAKQAAVDKGGKNAPPAPPPGPKAKVSPAWQPVTPETIATRSGNLASLPTIYFQVNSVINHPSSSTTDIAKALGSDQSLSARLLRIANSAFYGFPRKIENIGEAVRIIGTKQLHDLVLATVVLKQFKGLDPGLVNMADFWRHSLACGIAARCLAAQRREANVERYFLAGLLHDIGSLVIYQQLANRAQVVLEQHRETSKSIEELERTIIGCDHAAVGGALINEWKLPPLLRDVAANHHSLDPRFMSVGIAMVHVADVLVLSMGLGSNGELRAPRLNIPAWESLGLPPTCLPQVATDVTGLLAEAQKLFLTEDKA
jgi:HD-like signal output (HDOD) protein